MLLKPQRKSVLLNSYKKVTLYCTSGMFTEDTCIIQLLRVQRVGQTRITVFNSTAVLLRVESLTSSIIPPYFHLLMTDDSSMFHEFHYHYHYMYTCTIYYTIYYTLHYPVHTCTYVYMCVLQ